MRNADYDLRGGDVPRSLFPRGRVKFSLGAPPSGRNGGEAQRRRMDMERLRRLHAWDVLHAIQAGRLNVAEVSRRVRLHGDAAVPELQRELVAATRAVPTVREETERYLAWFRGKRDPQSVSIRRSRLKVLSEQAGPDGVSLGDVPLDRLVRGDVERAIQAIGGKPNTSESYRLAVSALFTWSIQEERERARAEERASRWDVNPASLVESYARESRVGTVPELDVLKLLTAAEPYQEAYLRAFLHLGLRLGELQHTRLGADLDVERWIWRIQRRGPDRRCACPQCSHQGWSPKTRRSVRAIAVPGEPAALREAIRTYLRLYPAQSGDFVFRNPRTDRVWISRSLATDFQVLCERAEVRYGRETEGGITLHTLRHTCATNLIRAGVRESIVAALLGDTVRTVVETYVNLSAEDLAAGVSRGPAYEL